jgi:hypothetical protein
MKDTLINNLPLIMMLTFLFGFPIVAPFIVIILDPIVESYDRWLNDFAKRYKAYLKKKN